MSKTIFELEEFKPFEQAWRSRKAKLEARKSYYDGSIYTDIKQVPMLGPRLYKHTKPLYLPLSRAVDVDVGLIPGGWELDPDLPEAYWNAQKILFAMSRWTIEGPLYVQYGAQYGVTGLKISDMRERGQVIMAPCDPQTFMLIYDGIYGQAPAMALVIDERVDNNGSFEYAEIVTAEAIRTYRDAAPWGFDGREPEYPNELGEVPFVEVPFLHLGAEMGEATFQKAIPMLNEVNQLASYLAEIIKSHAEAQWAIMGAEPDDLEKSGSNVWFVPNPQGKVQAIVASIDITGVLAFIEAIAGEVKDSLPELSFDELRRKDTVATATMELQLMELVVKIMRIRPNLDFGLVSGMQMAGRAAATMGVGDIAVLQAEDLALNQERPVLPLDPITANQLEMQELALERERAAVNSAPVMPMAEE